MTTKSYIKEKTQYLSTVHKCTKYIRCNRYVICIISI